MVNPTTTHTTNPSLNNIVYCANCAAAMVNTGERYCCPNAVPHYRAECPTNAVYADHLCHAVISKLVNRMATDDNIQAVSDSIKATTTANAGIQHPRMEQAEAAIADVEAKKHAFLRLVEHSKMTYQDVAPDINALNQATAGLAFESMVARKELDKIDFISDEQGIRDTFTSMETWRNGDNANDVQELLDLMVQKVTVDSEFLHIVYHVPMPTDEHPEGVTEDLLTLYPSFNAR